MADMTEALKSVSRSHRRRQKTKGGGKGRNKAVKKEKGRRVTQVRIELQVSHRITKIVAVGGVFVLLPAYLAISVLVIVVPVFVDILLDVPPLPVFDPIVQLCMADVAVLVSVNAVHDLSVGRYGGQGYRERLVEILCSLHAFGPLFLTYTHPDSKKKSAVQNKNPHE